MYDACLDGIFAVLLVILFPSIITENDKDIGSI